MIAGTNKIQFLFYSDIEPEPSYPVSRFTGQESVMEEHLLKNGLHPFISFGTQSLNRCP
ncbi:predicted protein [Arabidopsis lyrata subsp. lyrata]|uniref:Predicted protein n=1 Tax=Arabidopsis lyrata subsp. lyrata TaxID=81972 RepID=D7LJH0_ARALL|nr:predicted protein [Arabidopsis lyrata subsp. lyrata]